MKRTSFLLMVAGGVLLVATTVAASLFSRGQPHEKLAPAAALASPQELHYAAGAPQLDYLKIVPASALPAPLVEPMTARVVMDENRTARVFSPAAGRVVRIFVTPGATVKKSDALVEINAPDYATALADQRKADADFELKQRALRRQQELFDAGVVARKDLEGSAADFAAARAERDRARSSLHRLDGDAGNAGTLILRAPIDGVLASWSVNPGTEVRPDAADPLFVITDTRQLWVMLDAPESALGRLHPGQPVSIYSDSDPALYERAVIASLPAGIDPATRRLPVRCQLDNQDGKLRPEMYVRAIPYADGAATMVRVPDTALVTGGLYTYVFVETSPGTLARRRVHVAVRGHGESFVDTGVTAGDRLVVAGALLLDSELHGTGGE